eukprot:TRINITY_DN3587_c0_g1_i10.p1 TRINITY_DN3587_c0_g1~~TRINITY_DN3587_c0_g1_i10.p1  ORF type:complete len:155 (-),score=27.50 TRINITY_DN3587_c0_g1_i10:427-891(-)
MLSNVNWDQMKDYHLSKCEYIVKTKYFNAPIEFLVHLSENPSDIPTEQLAPVTDAMIFLFDPNLNSSWSTVLSWQSFVASARPNVLLCVATDKMDDVSRYLDWCVENQMEFISLYDKTTDPNEKVGLERIMEALGTNVWETIDRTPFTSKSSGE